MRKSITAHKFFPIGIAGSLAILSLLIIWKFPQWQVQPIQQQIDVLKTSKKAVDPKEIVALEKSKLDAENTARTVLVQGAGGLFAATAAYIAWRNFKTSEDKQIAERFSKAVDQLSSDKIEVRLGGIYSLERIVRDSPPDHWMIMETLSAFIREQLPLKPKEKALQTFAQLFLQEQESKDAESLLEVPTDIRAALTVIERRKRNQDPKEARIDLSRSNFSKLNLRSSLLEGADLSFTNLERANFAFANLKETNLYFTKFKGANLGVAHLERTNLYFADLEDANLSIAHLEETILRAANLKRANLGGANLKGAILDFANLEEAQLWDTNLQGANLKGASLKGAELDNRQLDDALLCETTLPDGSQSDRDCEKIRAMLSESESFGT